MGTEIDTKMNDLAHHSHTVPIREALGDHQSPQTVTAIKRGVNEVDRVLILGLYHSDSDDCRKHKRKKDKYKKQSHSRERKDRKKGLSFIVPSFHLHFASQKRRMRGLAQNGEIIKLSMILGTSSIYPEVTELTFDLQFIYKRARVPYMAARRA